MKTSTFEVGEMVSTLSAAGVQRQLSTLPGVHHVDVNYVAGSATVHYDEARVTAGAIQQRVVDCGYHCRGELVPAHVCEPADQPRTADVATGRTAKADHADPAVHADHADHASQAGHPAPGGSPSHLKADMMHDMGHAPGMSMQGMADDMRNRFLVALVFAVPVFLYSPMGEMFGSFATPFGMGLLTSNKPPEDEAYAVSHIPGAELRVIPGVWGHFAGGGVNPVDTEFINAALTELLES